MIWIYILIGLVVEFLVIVFAVALVGINKEVIYRKGVCPHCGRKLLDLKNGTYYCSSCVELMVLDENGNFVKKKEIQDIEELDNDDSN